MYSLPNVGHNQIHGTKLSFNITLIFMILHFHEFYTGSFSIIIKLLLYVC